MLCCAVNRSCESSRVACGSKKRVSEKGPGNDCCTPHSIFMHFPNLTVSFVFSLFCTNTHTCSPAVLVTLRVLICPPTLGDMNICRWGAAVGSLGPYLYICGGSDDASRLETVERFDPFTNVWVPSVSMSSSRNGVGVTSGNGRIYAIGTECVMSTVVKLYIFVVKGVQYFTEELSKVFFCHASTALFCFFFLSLIPDRCSEFLTTLFPGADPGGGRGGWPSLEEPIRTQSS